MGGAEVLPVVAQIAASLGLVTPLILGLYGFARDKKKEAVPPAVLAQAVEAVESPEAVDFESVAVAALNSQIRFLERDCHRLRAERDAARRLLSEAGLPYI